MRPTTRARGLAAAVVAAGLIFGACSSGSHSSTATTAGPGSTSRGPLSSGTPAGAAATGATINVGVVGSLTGAAGVKLRPVWRGGAGVGEVDQRPRRYQ